MKLCKECDDITIMCCCCKYAEEHEDYKGADLMWCNKRKDIVNEISVCNDFYCINAKEEGK